MNELQKFIDGIFNLNDKVKGQIYFVNKFLQDKAS